MNTTIKKIVALGVGATMLAGTAAMALAYDLSNYPEPFVKNGVFVGKLVIGEKASVIDVLGATDIAAALQRDAGVKVSAAAGATTVAGGVALDLTSDRINLGQGLKKTSLTNTDFPDLLQGMDFTNDAGTTFPYTQEIQLNTATAGGKLDFSKYSSNNDPALGFQLGTTSGNYLYKAKVTFTTPVNLTDANSLGQVITLFGRDFTIGSETTSTKLYLYGSSTETTLERGKDTTVTSNGNTYDVKVIGFSKGSDNKDQVIVSVNGVTGTITQGSSKKIPSTNGLQIFAKTVSSWNQQAEGIATLQLGSNKIVLQSGTTVKTGDSEDKIKGTEVANTGTWGNVADFTVFIFGTGSNEEEDYLLEGKSLVDPVFGSFKVDFPTVANDLNADRDHVLLTRGGDDRAVVEFSDKNGKSAQFTFAKNEGSGSIVLEDDSSPANAVSVVEGQSLVLNGYAMLPANDPAYGHLVQVSSLDLTNDSLGDDQIELSDVASGDTYKSTKYNYGTLTSHTINIDGKSYTLTSPDTTHVQITLTSGDNGVQVYPAMQLQGKEELALMGAVSGLSVATGATIVLPSGTTGVTTDVVVPNATGQVTAGSVVYNVTIGGGVMTAITPAVSAKPAIFVREEQDEQNSKGSVFIATTDQASSGTNYLGFSNPVLSAATKVGPISYENSDISGYVDLYGTFLQKTSVSGSNGEVRYDLAYPAGQMFANLFVAPVASEASTAASTGAVQLNPISVGMAIMDSDATLGGSTPYIVIGGPCANTVASALMGSPTDCAAGFTEGKATIKLYADKNALLVAGATGKDTQAASRVLSLYNSAKYASNFKGTELQVVTQTGSTDPTVSNVQ